MASRLTPTQRLERVETLLEAQNLYARLGRELDRGGGVTMNKGQRQEAKLVRREIERRFGYEVRCRTFTSRGGYGRAVRGVPGPPSCPWWPRRNPGRQE